MRIKEDMEKRMIKEIEVRREELKLSEKEASIKT